MERACGKAAFYDHAMATALPEVHPGVRLWLVDLDAADADGAQTLLSSDETARAARFVFDRHRARFIAGRAALRRILAGELGLDPAALAFRYGPAGKPSLEDGNDPSLQFNLSHSDRYAVVAVRRGGAVGVDIEKERPLADVMRLAQTAFSPSELEELRATAAESRERAFFTGWTRKEAYIKARGDRLAVLESFDVSLDLDRARLMRVDGQPAEPARWALASFVPVAGYAGAVCVETAVSSLADRR
jgi:4'-phosphopantetheinyl transferase